MCKDKHSNENPSRDQSMTLIPLSADNAEKRQRFVTHGIESATRGISMVFHDSPEVIEVRELSSFGLS